VQVSDWIILAQAVATFLAVGAALWIAHSERDAAKKVRAEDRASDARWRDIDLLRTLLVLIEHDRDEASQMWAFTFPRSVEARAIVMEFNARGGGVGGVVWEYYGAEPATYTAHLRQVGMGTEALWDVMREATLASLATLVNEEARPLDAA
jgi:hypothetical protein